MTRNLTFWAFWFVLVAVGLSSHAISPLLHGFIRGSGEMLGYGTAVALLFFLPLVIKIALTLLFKLFKYKPVAPSH